MGSGKVESGLYRFRCSDVARLAGRGEFSTDLSIVVSADSPELEKRLVLLFTSEIRSRKIP